MHIWAGSGSSSNGKETIRRRARDPPKTIRGLKKRKSSASIGLGIDGSCFNGEVGNLSQSPGQSPRKDSGIYCTMAFGAETGDLIINYVVEEDMVKPLNVGSVDSDSGRVNTIGRIEDGLKKLRYSELDKSIQDEVQVSTTSKLEGRGVPLKELDHAKEDGADDLSSSLSGLSHMMESNKRIFRAGREIEETQAATTNNDPNGNLLNTKSSFGTKEMVSKEIPQSNTTEIIQDNPQHPTLIRDESDREKIFSTQEVPERGRPNEYRYPGIAQENSQILFIANHSNTSSSGSENDMERVFSEKHEQISDLGSTDGLLSGEDSISVIGSVYYSAREDKAEGILNVRCEDVFGPENMEVHTGNESSTPDIKSLDASEGGNESEGAFSMSCEQVPELDMNGYLRGECSTIHFKSFYKAVDIPEEEIHRNASIVGFSLRVPQLVCEARQSLFTSLHSHKNDNLSPSQESMGEITSLKEIEFCASGLKNSSAGGDENSNLEPNLEDSPQIKHKRAIASVEGFTSNPKSTASLSVIDPFMTGDVVDSSTSVSVNSEAKTNANDSGKFPFFQGSTTTALKYPVRESKSNSPRIKNNENSLGFKDTRQDSVERDIKNSEAFSPVHQEVLNSMTPKHSTHHYLREKPDRPRESRYGTLFKPIPWTSHEDDRNLSQEGVPMERKPSRYPGEKRAFSQPGGSGFVSWSKQDFYSSTESDSAKSSNGHGFEEWLLGNEGSSESEEEMQRFWTKSSKGVVFNVWNVKEEIDMEGVNRGDERKRQNGENICGTINMSQGGFREALTNICRSIPQIDGQNSPPLLAVDSPVEPTRSPSPRKRLQKVNRSKSPSSAKKSSSSSLGKIFQNSRVEGMEGEIRDLKMEVEGLKRMVDELGRELRGVRARENSGCERVEDLGSRMEEVWGTIYGKGWEGGKTRGEGVEWQDSGEVEWTREVRDVGLLRVLGRMKRDECDEKKKDASDELLKRRGIESCEVDLMVSTSSDSKSKSKITMNDDGDELENEKFMSLDTPVSLEKQASKKMEIDGDMETTVERIVRKLLKLKSFVADDMRTSDEELGRLERETVSLQSETKVVGSGRKGCEDKGMMKGEGGFEKMKKENGNAKGRVVFEELPGDEDNREDNDDELALKKDAGHFNKEYNPDLELVIMDRDGRSKGQEKGFKSETRDDEKEKQNDGMRLEKGKGRTRSWRPDAVEMEGLVEVGISRGKEGDDERIRDEKAEEDEKEKKRMESLISDLLMRQEVDKVLMEEWLEMERKRDLEEIRGLRQMVEELKGLVLSGKGNGNCNKDEDRLHDCDKYGCGCCLSGGGNGGRGGKGGKMRKASNVANMRKRDVCNSADDEWDEEGGSEEERGGGNGNANATGNRNGKGFWDWVGGGILWRQD